MTSSSSSSTLWAYSYNAEWIHFTPEISRYLDQVVQEIVNNSSNRKLMIKRYLSVFNSIYQVNIDIIHGCHIMNTAMEQQVYPIQQTSTIATATTTTTTTIEELNIATLNVHGWKTETFSVNINELITKIHELKSEIHILSLNEVWCGAKLHRFATMCQYPYYIFGSAWGDFGNAILSKYPIQYATNMISTLNSGESRSFLSVQLFDVPRVVFSSTHLDHTDEEKRMKQLQAFLNTESILSNEEVTDHFVLGDFNALSKSDYTEEQLLEIMNVRRRNSWELPRFEVTNYMHSMGYLDCSQYNNDDNDDDEYMETCRFGTRIDYIYHKMNFSQQQQNQYSQNTKLETVNARPITDHNMLCVNMKLTSTIHQANC
jgi:endonuclease/exonuclease/phosphatase family metal-dependent hydrolase